MRPFSDRDFVFHPPLRGETTGGSCLKKKNRPSPPCFTAALILLAAHSPKGTDSQVESMKTHICRLPLSKQDGVTYGAEKWVSYDTAGLFSQELSLRTVH